MARRLAQAYRLGTGGWAFLVFGLFSRHNPLNTMDIWGRKILVCQRRSSRVCEANVALILC